MNNDFLHKRKSAIIIGIITGVAVVTIGTILAIPDAFQNWNSNTSLDTSAIQSRPVDTQSNCLTKEQTVARTKFNLLFPADSFGNRQLQCIQASSYAAIFAYSDKPINRTTNVSNQLDDGVILVRAQKEDTTDALPVATNITKIRIGIQEQISTFTEEEKARLGIQMVEIDGWPAFVELGGPAAGISEILDENDNVISKRTEPVPTEIYLYVGGTSYVIKGFAPLGDLIDMSKSVIQQAPRIT